MSCNSYRLPSRRAATVTILPPQRPYAFLIPFATRRGYQPALCPFFHDDLPCLARSGAARVRFALELRAEAGEDVHQAAVHAVERDREVELEELRRGLGNQDAEAEAGVLVEREPRE
jgi:hypothetical protein